MDGKDLTLLLPISKHITYIGQKSKSVWMKESIGKINEPKAEGRDKNHLIVEVWEVIRKKEYLII